MLAGEFGRPVAKALDFVIQFGDAFGAERLADVDYVHYPAEMAIYAGMVEEAVAYAATGARVAVPTTSSTLACDLEQWRRTGCPEAVHELQKRVVAAHRRMGVLGTYTCTPQLLGFVPPRGSRIVSVESSAIVYFNSVLGARTNRGGFLTRYSAVCGKTPLMGLLLDENRTGTHLVRMRLPEGALREDCDYSALGFYVGGIVGSGVPVFDRLGRPTQTSLLALGAALATSGSVALFHAPPHTAEASTVEEALGGRAGMGSSGREPEETIEVGTSEIRSVFDRMTTTSDGSAVDFVTLGCPHYDLEQIRWVAEWLRRHDARVHHDVRCWICTNRMTKRAAAIEGAVEAIERAGGLVVCDSCPVESHMRVSTCREHGLATPQIQAMVTDSVKMARYVGDLIGCRTALTDRRGALESAVAGRFRGRPERWRDDG